MVEKYLLMKNKICTVIDYGLGNTFSVINALKIIGANPILTSDLNLIKNSEESFEEIKQKEPNFKGNIDIEIDSNNDYIIIKIDDNGSGINDPKKAMTPYYTTKKTGTGLGLPIVTKIINEHDGNLSIKSKKDNNGTVVKILLPKYA